MYVDYCKVVSFCKFFCFFNKLVCFIVVVREIWLMRGILKEDDVVLWMFGIVEEVCFRLLFCLLLFLMLLIYGLIMFRVKYVINVCFWEILEFILFVFLCICIVIGLFLMIEFIVLRILFDVVVIFLFILLIVWVMVFFRDCFIVGMVFWILVWVLVFFIGFLDLVFLSLVFWNLGFVGSGIILLFGVFGDEIELFEVSKLFIVGV